MAARTTDPELAVVKEPTTEAERQRPVDLRNADAILEAIGRLSDDFRRELSTSRTEFRTDLKAFKTEVRDEIGELREGLRVVKHRIDGSNPPPANDDGEPFAVLVPRAAAQAGEATGDVAELRGELLAVRAELRAQSRAMGIGPRRFDWLPSKSTMRTIVRYATAAAAAYAAFHGH